MPDWLKVEFYAQLPDGLEVGPVDQLRTGEELARVFGFSRVVRIRLEQVDDGEPPTRRLVNGQPQQRFGGPDHPAHPSRQR